MKKRFISVIGMVTGLSLLVVSGITNAAGSRGYEDFKDATRTAFKMTSFTLEGELSVRFDGELMASGSHAGKYDLSNGKSSILSEEWNYSDSRARRTEEYDDGSRRVWGHTANDGAMEYSSYERVAFQETDYEGVPDEVVRLAELVADAMLGNTRDFFNRSDNLVTLELTNEQMPEFVNIGSAAVMSIIKQQRSDMFYETDNPLEQAFNDADQIKLANVSTSATLTGDNQFEAGEARLVLEIIGMDGTVNLLEVGLSGKLSDIGSTVPDTIDLTGKRVLNESSEKDNEYRHKYFELSHKYRALEQAYELMKDNKPEAAGEIKAKMDDINAQLDEIYEQSGKDAEFFNK